jgi:transcriptional regulator with XRE-family HTH domain
MPDSRIARAERRTRGGLVRLGEELAFARKVAGLTLAQVTAVTGISESELSRMERGAAPRVTFDAFSRAAAGVGAEVWFRSYPGGEPVRDIAHIRLSDAFRAVLGPGMLVRVEVPIGDPRDLRAWDMTIADVTGATCGIEFETRFLDAQDQLRRLTRKMADGGLDRVLLVIADTRANRAAVRATAGLLASLFVIQDPAVLDALAAGRVPPRDAVILLRVSRRRDRP